MKASFLFWATFTAAFAKADDVVDDTNESFSRMQTSGRPQNIILFMTDDQDVTANSIDPSVMPKLNRLFREGGMQFPNYYVPTGLCCPSRATILRGQYCHNTKVFDNGDLTNSTYRSGGWNKFLNDGLEEETIATLMQSAGYETGLIGKYMNGYDLYTKKAALHKPAGWDHWLGLLKCFNFYGPIFSDNGERILKLNKTVYQTDFIRDWVLDFLKNRRDSSKPFFLMVTPFAPHTPAIPAKRHEDLFLDAKFPRYDSFNPPDNIQQHRPAWIKGLPKLTQEQIDDMDKFYGNRLRSLQAVDEALESIVETLDLMGLTDETYFIYTADNGQHFGDHRIPAGKRQAFESDVQVPFLVRGPGIPKGTTSSQVVQSVDLGPTFLDLASPGNDPNKCLKSSFPMDGKSILPLLTSNAEKNSQYNDFRWAALLEMYGGSSNIGKRYQDVKGYYRNHMFPNTYQAVRVIDGPSERAGVSNLLYVEWCTGEQELYNMTVDPHQVHNILSPAVANLHGNASFAASNVDDILPLVHRLSKLLAKLGDCIGPECYDLNNEPFQLSLDKTYTAEVKRELSLESMQTSIRNRLPCHNPVNVRMPLVNGRPIPEPFTYGFPFSDEEDVGEDLLAIWEAYEHYFYS